jgi:tRNA modification GTPase
VTGPATPRLDDDIVAVSSAPGPGRRAIVRVTGPGTREIVAACFVPFTSHPTPLVATNPGGAAHGFVTGEGNRIRKGNFRLKGVNSPLPADLYFRKAPRTYTGQDLAELHLISSPPLVERLVEDLLAAGARPARPGEFTMRAFLAGKTDLPRAEAVLAVIDAAHDADLTAALAQLAGGVSRPLDVLRDDLLNLLADVEAGLDFVEEDIHFVTKAELLTRLDGALGQLATLAKQLDARGVAGRPVRVALVGEPNAGKSRLFNALVGVDAALVSPAAGTTRDYLTHRLTLAGHDVELIDTAGRADAADDIEGQAQTLGTASAALADLRLLCVPVDGPVPPIPSGEVVVRTKADVKHGSIPGVPAPVSAVTGEGLPEFQQWLTEAVAALAKPSLAPSQSRCRHHVAAASDALARAKHIVQTAEPPELLALELRAALGQIGEMTGAIYTNDLLDRVFGRFCIGK